MCIKLSEEDALLPSLDPLYHPFSKFCLLSFTKDAFFRKRLKLGLYICHTQF
jgi:hypothetical protein